MTIQDALDGVRIVNRQVAEAEANLKEAEIRVNSCHERLDVARRNRIHIEEQLIKLACSQGDTE